MSSSNDTNNGKKKEREHLEPEEGREPRHISRAHDRKWHICCVLTEMWWRGVRVVVVAVAVGGGGRGGGCFNATACHVKFQLFTKCFVLHWRRQDADSLGSKASYYSGLSDAGIITFLLIVYLYFLFNIKWTLLCFKTRPLVAHLGRRLMLN